MRESRPYRNASRRDRTVYKGTKYLLLKGRFEHREQRERLRRLLDLNATLFLVYVLRDMLKKIWTYRYRAWAERALRDWCDLAIEVDHPELTRFARRLQRYREGILNHCQYPIHTSKLEGINNKIKVIERKAYGFRDDRYFILKVKQAFEPETNSLFRRWT